MQQDGQRANKQAFLELRIGAAAFTHITICYFRLQRCYSSIQELSPGRITLPPYLQIIGYQSTELDVLIPELFESGSH